MYTLIIDTSAEEGIVALAKGDRIVASQCLQNQTQLADTAAHFVAELLKNAGVSPQDLQLIGVGIGPGSYTGIRVGVAFAQGLAFALGIPLVGICSLMGYSPSQEASFAAMVDARAGGAYAITGEKGDSQLVAYSHPQPCSIEELGQILKGVKIAVSPHVSLLQARLAELGIAASCIWEKKSLDPAVLLMAILQKFKSGGAVHNGVLEILYLRKTQAERNRDAQ